MIENAINNLDIDKFLNNRSTKIIKHKCSSLKDTIDTNFLNVGDGMNIIDFHKNIISKYFTYVECKVNSFYISKLIYWSFDQNKVILINNNDDPYDLNVVLWVNSVENVKATLDAFNHGAEKYGMKFDILNKQQLEIIKDGLNQDIKNKIITKLNVRPFINLGTKEVIVDSNTYKTGFIEYTSVDNYYTIFPNESIKTDISMRLVYNPRICL